MAWQAGGLAVVVCVCAAECECGDVVADGCLPYAVFVSQLAEVAVALEYALSALPVLCGGGARAASAPAVLVLWAACAWSYELGAALDTAVLRRSHHSLRIVTLVEVHVLRVPTLNALRCLSRGRPSGCFSRVGPSLWSTMLGQVNERFTLCCTAHARMA